MLRYEITRWPVKPEPEKGDSADQLESALGAIGEKEQFQVWLYDDDTAIACLLCNRELAHHRILSRDGSGESDIALDREHEGEEELTEEIYLENGQLDQFSREVCIPKPEGTDAIIYFFRYQSRSPRLQWIS